MTDGNRPPLPAAEAIPDCFKQRNRWLMWDNSSDTPRRPHWRGDFFNISWNDPDDWHTFENAVAAARERESWGIGYVFQPGDDEYMIDIDGPFNADGTPREWFPGLSRFIDADAYMEWSPGDGIHIPVEGQVPEWWRDCEINPELHQGVEVLTNKFCTFTGNPLDESGETVTDVNAAPFLFNCYQNIRGESPRIETDEDDGSSRDYNGDEWLTDDLVEAALDEIDSDLPHNEWIQLGYAVHDYDDGSTGKRLFEEWSQDGEKWDSAAQRSIDSIWTNGGNGDVTIATLVYKAKEAGWDVPTLAQPDGGAAAATTGNIGSSAATEAGGRITSGDDTDIVAKFTTACNRYQIDSGQVGTEIRDGEKVTVGVRSIVPTSAVEHAVFAFKRNADRLSGVEKQAVIGYVILLDLQERGEFFKTSGGGLYYFHEDETHVYRVDATGGRRVLTEDFQAFVWERYNLFAGTFSRNLGKDIKSQARRHAPERAVYRFAHYDEQAGELYINDFGDGYYAVTPAAVEWRPNGTDVFFLPNERAEAFAYIEPDDRPELPAEIPGERPTWNGTGDAIMRAFGNRVNYDERAALGPSDQRNQLYIHLHTLPFIDVLNARPIMAWVGEKGSGKTVLQRSIGRFIYGDEFTESVMPDSKDDFLAKVTNQALAFLDNYDDGVEWANDILAAVATGAGIDLRELYTTNALRQEVPRCWLSLTSRDPPFRRDDVADRTLVFRVERVEDGFVGMGDYLRQVTAYRDLLWSEYLDNLQAVVRVYHDRDTESMSSDHRMADWAIFAQVVGDALDVAHVGDLLDTMETERATFALENEPWARVLGHWIEDNPDQAAEYRPASDLGDELEACANEHDLPINVTHAAALGSKLATYHTELAELYGLKIDDSGRSNTYRFAADDDGHKRAGLGRYR